MQYKVRAELTWGSGRSLMAPEIEVLHRCDSIPINFQQMVEQDEKVKSWDRITDDSVRPVLRDTN